MALKKVKKKVAKKVETADSHKDVLIENLLIEANTAMGRIKELEQRIDRIVRAIDKSKSVKGM